MAEITTGAAWGIATGTPAQGFSGPPTPAARYAWTPNDGDHGGSATITGITQLQTGPATYVRVPFCPVWLYDQATGQGPIRKTVSDANGDYTFEGLRADRTYFDVAFHPQGLYDVAATRNLEVTP